MTEHMQPIMSPEAVSRWWGIEPELRSSHGATRGACALWTFRDFGKPIDCRGEADPHTHIVSVGAVGRSRQEYFGDGRLRFAGPCRPGLLNIVVAGEQPRAIVSSEGSAIWSYFHVYLPHAVLAETLAASELELSPGGITLIDPQGVEDRDIGLATGSILRELREGGALSRLRIDVLYQDIAIHLLRRYSNRAGDSNLARGRRRGGLAPWQLKRACEAIEANAAEGVGLATLAAVAGCSPTHFSRAFKQSTGLPPLQWLAELRIERAKALLLDTGTSLSEVAVAVGFSAQPQFTTAFRRATGTTPGAWRRERLS